MPFDETMFLKQSVDILSFFNEEQLRKVTPDIERMQYKKDQSVVFRGEMSNGFYVIKNGGVIATLKDPKAPATTLKKGDFFGALSLLLDQPSDVQIKASEDNTEIMMIPIDSFNKLLAMQPLLKNSILKKVEERKAQEPPKK
ncbi:cyclic nucleotide-binding domain-containing protein [Elusimicrobiota bacterium]